jgi:predicted membrane chloride channel (bestrophin family)
MKDWGQRTLWFFLLMLPITTVQAKKYWWAVVLWVFFLVCLSIFAGKQINSIIEQFGASLTT